MPTSDNDALRKSEGLAATDEPLAPRHTDEPPAPRPLPANWPDLVKSSDWASLESEDLATIVRHHHEGCESSVLEPVFKELSRRASAILRKSAMGLGGRRHQIVEEGVSGIANALVTPVSKDGDALCTGFDARVGNFAKRGMSWDKHDKHEADEEASGYLEHEGASLQRRLERMSNYRKRLAALKDPRHRLAVHRTYLGSSLEDTAAFFKRTKETIRKWILDFIDDDPDRGI